MKILRVFSNLSYPLEVTNASPNIASRYLQRRVLLLSLVPLGMLFALTVTLSRTYHVREEGLVREWLDKGNADLSAGQPGIAIEDFRNALSYDPENSLVQPRLAEALLADGQLTEARYYFLNLWDRTPGSGEVNLDLAHLSIRMGDADEAIRYFRGSIYGSWEKDPAQQRRNTRLELCEFLVAQRRTRDAQAEIAGLAADTPADDGTLLDKTGQLFTQAGEPNRALAEFEAALRTSPRQNQWLEDAGRAAYATGDYAKAETYLARAIRETPSNEIVGLLGTVRDVQSGDPFLPGLSDKQQAERTWRALQQGLKRLQDCNPAGAAGPSAAQPPSDLQSLNKDAQDLKRRVNLPLLRLHSELRIETMQLVFRIEQTTSQTCGTPTGADQALILIGRRHSGSNP
jgi:tetratricopeptide (TPR) repeat protein